MQSNAGPNAGPAQKQASPEPAQSGAFATSAVKSQGGAPARRPQRSALLRVPAWLRWALIALLLGLIALASIVAARQAPHPDMFRKVGVWDFAAPGWWAYPLERNAFKRTVVHGHLYAVFALPGTGKLWAVGDGGLIVHSADDGATWVQQRPVAAAAAGGASAAKRRTSAWSWLPQATAASPDPKAQSSGRPEAQQQQPLQKQQQPPQQQQQQLPPEQAQQPLLDKSESSRAPPTPPSMTRPEQSGVAEQASGKAAPPQKAAATPAQKAPPAPPAALPASAPAAQAADAKLEAPAAPPQPTPVVPVTTESATLNGVHFAADGVRGWAVGFGGTIVATRDGGASWVAQSSGTRATLTSVQFAADGVRGWAVGAKGTILATRDGGASWVAQTSGTQASLTSVQFAADGVRGWAVVASGTIVATRDGGASWVAQASDIRTPLFGVHFAADGVRGWAVGSEGTILATRDGGASWVAQASDTQATLASVQFAADGVRGWAAGASGTIVATRDGGASWVAKASGTRSSLMGVQFAADGVRGWAVGSEGTILATRDGGASWVAQASGTQAPLVSVQFAADGVRGWAVGDSGTILATRDGGASWVAQTSGTQAFLTSVQFAADGVRGWAVGNNPTIGTIVATRDGGASWVPQASGIRTPLLGVHFAADGVRGWAVGSEGTILVTRDGGASWVAQASGTQAWLNGVQFAADGVRGWAVGIGGTIVATRDGGASWVPLASGIRTPLLGVHFAADGVRGWAVGSEGTILVTRDGGASWVAQASGTRASLIDVQFAADGVRGWAVGSDGTIVATRDGGASWVAQASGTQASLRGVQFVADGVRGWAVGDGSTIVATRDGGKQWADPAPYRLTWAPWYFATLPALALALFGVLAFVEPVRRGEAAADEQLEDGADGAGTFLRSDQPVADKAFDRLGVRPVVEALSSFIRNRGTEPRVTIAVTGEWGNGKSSVMRMLQTDLDRAGFRSAWFNAWHHQQEGRPLSALFNVVRQQAVPQWWRQPLAALRVRSRLIWGRGAAYKLVAVATALALALAAGDMFADGWRVAFDNARHFVRHHVLQKRETAITGASLAKLDPFSRAAPAPAAAGASKAAAAAGASARNAGAPRRASHAPVADACETKTWPAGAKAEPLRPEVYCYLKRNLVWDEGGDASRCGVQHDPPVPRGRECVFAKAEDLIKTIEARDARAERSLWPSEKKAIRAAAETLPPPPLFPWLEGALVGGAAAFLALLFTKGISVYGLQLTAPLRALLAAATGGRAGDEGKESSGTVERYRAEFGLLCDALDGRLVIFIDDLDRCSPETVNGVLELTNYLADISRCFIVIGAAMERVLRCVRSPVASDDHTAYATAYLRKLVHIELPVPQNRQLLERLAAADPTTTPTHEVRSGLRRWAWRAALGAAALAALLASFYGGKLLHDGAEGVALRVNPVVARAEPVIDTPAAAAPNTEAIALQPRTSRDSEPVGLAATPPPTVPLDWLAAAALLGAAALAWRWWRRNRETVVVALGGAVRDEDSDRFMRALQIWNPVVVSYDPTPRHVKRFYNRARLFAAYEREHAGADAARDESLVAMAAMHHLDPALLPSLAAALGDDGDDGDRTRRVQAWVTQSAFESGFAQPPNDDDRQRQALRERLLDAAWTAHIDAFGTAPSAEQVRRFERSVEGILVR